ncbi:MAG TPA: hypothetical protein VES91_03075 [Burkholderiaceae bacterium]|nr:hypothetical protein [Burkholderiaceae bacterium]
MTDDPARRILVHPGRGFITIAYEVAEISHDPIDHRRFYLPLLRNEFAHFFGHGVWVLPTWSDSQPVNLRITVDGFPKNWTASGSSAERAGLREGDQLLGWSHFDDPTRDAELNVERDGAAVAVIYSPASNETVSGVEFLPRPDAEHDAACRAWIELS